METVLLHQLSIGYLTKGRQKVVAAGLDATLHSGELTCLLGRNGVGKSTLLRTLASFQPALAGEVVVNGTPLLALTDRQLSRQIGIVLTDKPDVQNMTAEELVAMGRSPYTGFWGTLGDEDRRLVDDAIRQVGIEELRHRQVQTLSDGERQKVMIAKALAQQTPVIYLDEPTAFLDYPSKLETIQLLLRLAHEEQKTIFLSTHDVELAIQTADRLWLMEPARLHVGTARELSATGALCRFIEHDGIVFDAETLTIRVKKNND